jgi:hypothetical protein
LRTPNEIFLLKKKNNGGKIMYAGKTKEVKVDRLPMEGVKNTAIQWLISEKEGAKKFVPKIQRGNSALEILYSWMRTRLTG